MSTDAETDRVRTHWEECWRERNHHACAVARIEKLKAERDRYRGTLKKIATRGHVYQISAVHARDAARQALSEEGEDEPVCS